MGTRTRGAAVVLLSVVLVVGSGIGTAIVSPPGGDAAATLVVDSDGGADYTAIQAAVDAADAGDTVEVRPGEYAEELVLDKSITLTAPDGATLNGSAIDRSQSVGIAVSAGSSAAPTIRGFNITGYRIGIKASLTSVNLTVADTTVHSPDDDDDGPTIGFDFRETDGAWKLDGVTMRGHLVGVYAPDATGDWSVTDTTSTGSKVGIDAVRTTGDWSVSDTSVDRGIFGIAAFSSEGDWVLDNVTISTFTGPAVIAMDSSGAWTIRDSVITNVTAGIADDPRINPVPGVGILANETTGAWTVTNTELTDLQNEGIDATDAAPAGNATGNWWGQESGPEQGDCVGTVDCGQPLSSPPSAPLTEATVSVLPTESVVSANGTTQARVAANLSDGLERVSVNLTVGNTSAANVSSVSVAGSPSLKEVSVPDDGSGVNFEVAYLSNPIETDGTETLIYVTLDGQAVGETDLTLSELEIEDADGEPYERTGLSNATLDVVAGPVAPTLPGASAPASNLDSDPLLEDVNGDGSGNIFDAIALYNNRNSDAVQQNPAQFNFDGNVGVTLFDAIALYNELSA